MAAKKPQNVSSSLLRSAGRPRANDFVDLLLDGGLRLFAFFFCFFLDGSVRVHGIDDADDETRSGVPQQSEAVIHELNGTEDTKKF